MTLNTINAEIKNCIGNRKPFGDYSVFHPGILNIHPKDLECANTLITKKPENNGGGVGDGELLIAWLFGEDWYVERGNDRTASDFVLTSKTTLKKINVEVKAYAKSTDLTLGKLPVDENLNIIFGDMSKYHHKYGKGVDYYELTKKKNSRKTFSASTFNFTQLEYAISVARKFNELEKLNGFDSIFPKKYSIRTVALRYVKSILSNKLCKKIGDGGLIINIDKCDNTVMIYKLDIKKILKNKELWKMNVGCGELRIKKSLLL